VSKLMTLVPFFLLGRLLNATRAMKYKGSNNKCEGKRGKSSNIQFNEE